MTAKLEIRVDTSAADAAADIGKLAGKVQDLGNKAAGASTDVDKTKRSITDVADAADDLGSTTSQTAGGLGDLGGALGLLPGPLGKLGAGMEAAAPAIMGVTGAADLLNVITTKFPRLAGLATKATQAQAAAQRALNVVMRLNPIGLVIAALTLLGTGLFVAYKKSETFRNVCDGAFRAVAAAGRWMWNTVLAPVFRFLLGAIAAVLDMWGNMLGALGKVPGFGWARTAAEKMHNAADKCRDLKTSMEKVPGNVPIKINTRDLDRAKRLADSLRDDLVHILNDLTNGVLGRFASNGHLPGGRTSSRDVGTQPTAEITINGALDPVAVGRQLVQLLRTHGIIVNGSF